MPRSEDMDSVRSDEDQGNVFKRVVLWCNSTLSLTDTMFRDTLHPVARKKKEAKKEDVKFAKYLPGEARWKGRVNKTRQDRLAIDDRDRVHNADRVRSFSQKHKPARSADWLKFR